MLHRAVLLAAGRGTRLAPLTLGTPKCLVTIGGRALIDLQLEALAAVGIHDITIVAGFMAKAVISHVGARARVVVNHDYVSTGSIVSLALAAPHLRGHAFLLQNADTLYPTDLLRRFVTAPRENACLVHAPGIYRPGEYHVQVAQGRIVSYDRDLPPEHAVGESAQLLRVGAAASAPFLDRLDDLVSTRGPAGFPNQAYDVLMQSGGLWPVFTAGLPWWEIDSADDLERCTREHRAHVTSLAPAPPASRALPGIGLARRVASLKWGRFRWVPPTIAPLARHPLRVAGDVKRHLTGRLSLRGLDLAANGEHFLRLAYAEARAVGLEPLLVWGTLLGCVRHAGFITGDHDIDLAVMASEAHRLPAWRDRLFRRGFNLRIENDCKLSVVHPRHPRLFIDVDVVVPHRDGWAIINKNADPVRRFVYHFPRAVFDGAREAAFERGLTVRIPADPEGFLRAVYGDWRTPAAKVDYRYGPLNTEVELVGVPVTVPAERAMAVR